MKYSMRYKVANLLRNQNNLQKAELCPEVVEMRKDINSLENKNINFEIKVYPDGSWTARSTNVDGLLTGSRKQSEANELLKDAILTYYNIPAKYAQDRLLRNTSEPITVDQQVRVTA